MNYDFDFSLEFNEDCDNPKAIISGIFTSDPESIIDQPESELITITKFKISTKPFECDYGCGFEAPMSSVTDFKADNLPEGYNLVNDSLEVNISNGVQLVSIYLEWEEEDESTSEIIKYEKTITRCVFNHCGVLCQIHKYIADNLDSPTAYLLRILYEGITYSIICEDCCSACEMYKALNKELNALDCKPCK